MDTSADQSVRRTATRGNRTVRGCRVIAGVGSDDTVLVVDTRRHTVVPEVILGRSQQHLIVLRRPHLTTG